MLLVGAAFSLAAGGWGPGSARILLGWLRAGPPRLRVAAFAMSPLEALMSDPDHPAWCAIAFCTVDRPPMNGHQFGAHRSLPQVVDATVLRLSQTRTAVLPSLEVRRGDALLVLPLVEAQSLAPAIDDLLEAAGVGL